MADPKDINEPSNVGTPYWRASLGMFGTMAASIAFGLMAKDWQAGLMLFGGGCFVISIVTPRN